MSDAGDRRAAGRVGVPLAEYRARRAAGERWCPRCKAWLPAAQVPSGWCRACRRHQDKQRAALVKRMDPTAGQADLSGLPALPARA